MRKGSESRYGEVEGDRSAEAGSHEPDAFLILAKRAGSLSDFSSPGGIGVRVTYSREKAPTAVIKAKSSTTWQGNATAKWNDCARRQSLKYVTGHRKRVENGAERRVIVMSLEPFCEHARSGMVPAAMEGVGG